MTRVCDFNFALWLISGTSWSAFAFSNNIHAFNYFTENDMFAVQPISLDGSDEELGAVSEKRWYEMRGGMKNSVVLKTKIMNIVREATGRNIFQVGLLL